MVAASMILAYAEKNHLPRWPTWMSTLSTYSVDGFMRLDPATAPRSLELRHKTSPMPPAEFTLLGVLDENRSPPSGPAWLIRRWIEQPLLDLPYAIQATGSRQWSGFFWETRWSAAIYATACTAFRTWNAWSRALPQG